VPRFTLVGEPEGRSQMSRNENNLIQIPKFTDGWLKKLWILLACLLLAYLLPPDENVKYILAMVAAYVVIIGEELRIRALMINLMDHQLIHVSKQADDLQSNVEAINDKTSALELELERLKNC
jgi:hypothetical protein